MARRLRLEFAGGIYRLLGRGKARQRIFASKCDWDEFAEVGKLAKQMSNV